ncbi:MAG: hypothetical protein QOD57_5287 [Actinomycetota bacterium]|jgi:hypothetical protein|nr:hypothetical protein [Actinomycetota bacterium]
MTMVTSTHEDQAVRRPWLDLSIAGFLAVVMLNLHVSSGGDALSSLDRGDRKGFYALLAVLGVVLLAATLRSDGPAARWSQGCLGFATATGIAGLLLDVQDGPVRTVQLVVLFGFFLAAATTVRLIRSPRSPA